jgi:sialic acid synthase SpsE
MDPTLIALIFSASNIVQRGLQLLQDAQSGKQPTPEDLNSLRAETQSLHDQAHALLPGAAADPQAAAERQAKIDAGDTPPPTA